MNAIPEQIRMRLFERSGAGGLGPADLAQRAAASSLRRFAITERRRRKRRAIVFFGRIKNRDRLGQRSGDGLVDERRLARLQAGQGLLQMRPAIVRFQEHAIDSLQQLIERIHDFDTQRLDICR